MYLTVSRRLLPHEKEAKYGEDGISMVICTLKVHLAKSINVPYSRDSSFSKPQFP